MSARVGHGSNSTERLLANKASPSKQTGKEQSVEEQLSKLRSEDGGDQKCVDMKYMVFNYGKFHNNIVN